MPRRRPRYDPLPDLSGARPPPAARLPPALALPDGRLLLPFRRRSGGLSYDERAALAALLPLVDGPPPLPCWCDMATGRMSVLGPIEPGWMARQAFDRAEVRL